MDSPGEGPFNVEVHLMSEPCLWRWEIRGRDGGEIVANSWACEWMAYDSAEDALRARRQRMVSLRHRRRDGTVAEHMRMTQ
jgi:hypothetical protein